jgi:alpha-tubulin suppressor-like RCC1 family protein
MYALRANGQIARWGEGILTPTLVSGISDAVDIAAGWGSACALRANGEVVCWGRGERGQHGDGLAESNRAAPSGKVLFKVGTAPVVSISGDDASFCSVHADGQVNCWGENSGGNLGDGTTNTAFEPVLAERWDTRIDYPDMLVQ